MNGPNTEAELRQQLAAMGCARVDLGALSQAGWMTLATNWSAKALPSALRWLRRENARGAHIYIRPTRLHQLSLIDDLTADAIEDMKHCGAQIGVTLDGSLALRIRRKSVDYRMAWRPSSSCAKRLAEHIRKPLNFFERSLLWSSAKRRRERTREK
jgi:hypothetical protein